MVRPEVVRRKLSRLQGYLDELEPHRSVSLDTYRDPGGPRRAIERLLQLVVEVAVDINVHAVAELGSGPPPDYRSSFAAAAGLGLIDSDLAERLTPAVGLCNVLVHEYGEIRDELVCGAIGQALDDFRSYASAVQRWLDENYPG